MGNYRQHRVNEEMAKELADILRSVKDYRVTNALISITRVDCTKDLKYAKVYFSCVGKASASEVLAGLKSAQGYIRSALATRLNLRQTPELNFIYDESMEHGAHILQLLHEVGADKIDEEQSDETVE
jgi:ribosome-binding factor A